MIDWQWLSKTVLAQTNTTGHSGAVTVLIAFVLAILGIAVLLFLGLVVLRLLGSRRERRFDARKEHLSPLVYDLLTEDRSVKDVVATLQSVVPARDRKALEQVLLENIRFLKGREREALTTVFDEMGFADEDVASLEKRGTVHKAEAAYHLGTMRSARAVPALISALESSEKPEVAFSCLNALSKIGTPESLKAVVAYLASSPELETLRVAEVILERKLEFSEYLVRWLERGEPDLGRLLLLIDLMGAMKDVRAVPLLVGFLKHDEARVRTRAAFSLGNIGDFTVCDDLIESMEDSNADVRAESAEALGKLQCEPAIPRLKLGLADENLTVQMNCAVALSQLGEDGRAVLEDVLLTTAETQIEAVEEVLETFSVRGHPDREGL